MCRLYIPEGVRFRTQGPWVKDDKMILADKYYASYTVATFTLGSDQKPGQGVTQEAGKRAECNRIHPR